jgi:hypothetical protein
MTTEAWDEYYKPNLTWNHAWGAAPANIIPRRLMGVRPIEAGFKRFSIVPQPSTLKNISLTVPTITGAIFTELKVEQKNGELSWNMQVSVPGNSEAELWLPASFKQVTLNGKLYTDKTEKTVVNAQRRLLLLSPGNHRILAI